MKRQKLGWYSSPGSGISRFTLDWSHLFTYLLRKTSLNCSSVKHLRMYCQQQYPYQTEHHQQHGGVSIYGLPLSGYPTPNYASSSPYSPPADRPSPPSFRIDDILLQSKNGHFPTYSTPYSSGFSSPSSVGHGYSYRVAHGMAHQHEGPIDMPMTMHSCGTSNERDYQGKGFINLAYGL